MLNPLFAKPDIEVERGVILQEIGQALDTPDDIIFDWLQEAAYPGAAVRAHHPRAGGAGLGLRPAATSRASSREHYGPDRMILAAAGAVDPDALRGAGRAAVRPSRRGGRRCRCCRRASPAASGARRAISSRCTWRMAFEAPGVRDDAAYAAQIYATALGGGMSSRLFQELRERRGLCYTIFAQAGAYDDTGLITLYAGTGAGADRASSTELTMDELRRAADGPDRGRARPGAGADQGRAC